MWYPKLILSSQVWLHVFQYLEAQGNWASKNEVYKFKNDLNAALGFTVVTEISLHAMLLKT